VPVGKWRLVQLSTGCHGWTFADADIVKWLRANGCPCHGIPSDLGGDNDHEFSLTATYAAQYRHVAALKWLQAKRMECHTLTAS